MDATVPTLPRERRWLRMVGLALITMTVSPARPLVLIGLPFALMTMIRPGRHTLNLLAAGLMAGLVMASPERAGLWYSERGWALLVAGWFMALTLVWPTQRFLTRVLGAVTGGLLSVVALFAARPEYWQITDWLVAERVATGTATALEAVRLLQGEGALSPALVATVYQTAELQGMLFPALLGLATVAGMGAAWWMHVRLVWGSDRGLGGLRDFRFNDQLVWLLIGGLALLLFPRGGGMERTGANAVTFIGALYAARGAAVFLFLNNGVSFLGGIVLALGLVFLAPILLGGAMLIGVGDTWLDFRARAQMNVE